MSTEAKDDLYQAALKKVLHLSFELHDNLHKLENLMDGYCYQIYAVNQVTGEKQHGYMNISQKAYKLINKRANTYRERLDKVLTLRPFYISFWMKLKIGLDVIEKKIKNTDYEILCYKKKPHLKTRMPQFFYRNLCERFDDTLLQIVANGDLIVLRRTWRKFTPEDNAIDCNTDEKDEQQDKINGETLKADE